MNVLVVLAVILVFGLLVTVHEFGHFVVAKLNGVKVLEFNVGFGAPLLQRQGGETKYAIRAIPLGGYVRLAGMDDGETGPRSFNEKAVWQRFSIIVAGAAVNLALPLIILIALFMGTAGPGVIIDSVSSGGPAAQAGLASGDRILELNGRPVDEAARFRDVIQASQDEARQFAQPQHLWLRVRHRDDGEATLQITPQLSNSTGKYRWVIGVLPTGTFSLGAGVVQGSRAYVDQLSQLLGGIGTMVSGHLPGGLGGACGPSGPVGIVRMTAEAASTGWQNLVYFAAFLSLNLGILNLLPLPALDGGRLAFLLVEAVRRRRIDPRIEQRVHYIGIVVLLTFIALVTVNDLMRLQVSFSALIKSCQG